MTQTKALEVQKPGALALPAFVDPTDRRGADNITGDDIRLPRLSLAQATSPEVTKGDPKKIDGLEAGDIFSNLLQTNYKEGPVEVVIVRREKPRAMEFWPRKGKPGYVEGKSGIKERDVPLDDPRCSFGPDGEAPAATVFHEYVAFDLATKEPFILSFKATSANAARAINTFLALRKGPAFATSFKLSSASKVFADGTAYLFNVQPGRPVDQETFDFAVEVFENFKGREVAAPEDEAAGQADHTADYGVPF
jgi:hypothetical protein